MVYLGKFNKGQEHTDSISCLLECSNQAMPSLQSHVGHRIHGHKWSIESVYFEDQISAELMETYFVNAKCNGCSKSCTGYQ